MTHETLYEEIPRGGQQRMLLGVPTTVTMLCLIFGIGPALAYGTFVPLLVLWPIWGFLRFQHQRDPYCLRVWWDHVTLAQHYEG